MKPLMVGFEPTHPLNNTGSTYWNYTREAKDITIKAVGFRFLQKYPAKKARQQIPARKQGRMPYKSALLERAVPMLA